MFQLYRHLFQEFAILIAELICFYVIFWTKFFIVVAKLTAESVLFGSNSAKCFPFIFALNDWNMVILSEKRASELSNSSNIESHEWMNMQRLLSVQ